VGDVAVEVAYAVDAAGRRCGLRRDLRPAVDVAIDMACVVALVDAAYAVNAAGCRCPPLTWLVSSPSSTQLGADVAVDAAGSRCGR